jgi:hypothetical protein
MALAPPMPPPPLPPVSGLTQNYTPHPGHPLEHEESGTKNHAHGTYEQQGNGASGDVLGSYSNGHSLNGPRGSLGVAQTAIHSQVASQGTNIVKVHDADLAIHILIICVYI